MSIIAVFPGQGSQTIGMGMQVSKTIKSAKNVLDEVDDALNFKLSEVMKDGNEETLRLTKNAQPALMATGIAIVRAIEEISGKNISQIVSHSAGHSLGEYTALVSAGSISISDAAKLLRIRGEAMQNAVPVGLGSMVAILGVTIEDIEYFIGSVGNNDGLVEIANDNAPGQVVISGDLKTLNLITSLAKKSGVRKIIKLSVSAPFHCSLMKSAADTMEKAFQDINILEPNFPIISNVSAIPETSPQIIKNNLILQVTKTVRWRETMASLSRLGISQIVEMGTGKVLTGLAKRGANNLSAINLETSEDIKKWLNAEKLI